MEGTQIDSGSGLCAGGRSARPSSWYLGAMERLVGVVQGLSHVRDVEAVTEIVGDAARSLTGADGATFVLRDGDQCYYVEENAIAPLWKGRRFPMSACISGWVMLNARPAVIEDIYADSRVPADAYRPTFVKSLAMVPIRRSGPIGSIGNYWARRRLPSGEEVAILQALADTTSVALENVQLYGELKRRVDTLQEQEVRIQAQRDALAVFTRALAHDLKEPVRTIQWFAGEVENGEASAEASAGHLQRIRTAAERMRMLIETVFQYTQLDEAGEIPKAPCDMERVLRASRENLAHLIREHGARVTNDPLPRVHANPAHMTQVMQNLLSNAVRHGRKGGTVHVRAERLEDHWRFSVRDDGPGIAPEHRERIFLPFKRLVHQGDCAGLGLTICRKIVEFHGGRIWCDSARGEGTTLYFTLKQEAAPAPEPAEARTGARTDASDAAGASLLASVLLVDDSEADVEIARTVLIERGELQCNLLVASDGEEGLDLLRGTIHGGGRIDMMLLDISMPPIDGFELLERIRDEDALHCVPVVMCSGSQYEKDRQRAAALGAVGYVVKPPSFSALGPILERIPTVRLVREGSRNRLVPTG